MSNPIELVISFDTTGSMYPCIGQVKREVNNFINQLMNDIPNMKIGIIAHGDYCDANSTYVIKDHPLTDDKDSLINFVKNCGNTGGGDFEECYELVLHKTRSFTWTAGCQKILVLIGDAIPHSANDRQNTLHLDWRNELGCLLEMGVKVYGVQALNHRSSASFYKEISTRTGGFHLTLNQFSEVIDLINAICQHQDGGLVSIEKFEQKLQSQNKLTRSMIVNIGRLKGNKEEDIIKESRKKCGDGDLAAVPPGRFQVLAVDKDCIIKDFVEENGLIFQKGKGFYEFTKSTKIQDYKEVVLMDKTTGDMFTGEKAREIMEIPIDRTAKKTPTRKDTNYITFIQSTSYNRKLIGGTKFLYEVDTTR